MKRYIVYILLILTGFCVSCDEYLETKTYGEVLPETTEDYASLIHTHLNNIESSSSDKILGTFTDVLRLECFSDNLNASLSTSSSSYTPVYVGSYVSSAMYRFNNLFQVVRDVNVVLDNIEETDSELSKKIIAVSYTLRAILYYNMMRDYVSLMINNGQPRLWGYRLWLILTWKQSRGEEISKKRWILSLKI